MMADSENPTEEEKYLRGIWDSLGVGKNGYISIKELKQVCRHIGMEEMTSAVSSNTVMCRSRGGWGDRVSEHPENHKNIGFLAILVRIP